MQCYRLTGLIGSTVLISAESGSASGESDSICLFDCALPESRLV
jgi:hypothetical protein